LQHRSRTEYALSNITSQPTSRTSVRTCPLPDYRAEDYVPIRRHPLKLAASALIHGLSCFKSFSAISSDLQVKQPQFHVKMKITYPLS
jgi:hypothetical protein